MDLTETHDSLARANAEWARTLDAVDLAVKADPAASDAVIAKVTGLSVERVQHARRTLIESRKGLPRLRRRKGSGK